MFSCMRNRVAGFTLIELLIVIGIIVILSVVVILTLNPAQLLAQSRDSRRVSDLSALQSALSLYLADVTSPNVASDSTKCYHHASSGPTGASLTSCGGRFTAALGNVTTTLLTVTGNGWIPVDFTSISSGAPISSLPLDPVNDATYYFAYAGTSTLTYEINVNLESTKYTSGAGNLEGTDGGTSSTIYEVGTNPGLAL